MAAGLSVPSKSIGHTGFLMAPAAGSAEKADWRTNFETLQGFIEHSLASSSARCAGGGIQRRPDKF
jgi:hypothetical protein